MNNHVTYDLVKARLEENGIPHGTIETGAADFGSSRISSRP